MAPGQPQVRPSLAKQAGWLMVAKVIAFAIGFVAPLVIARALPQNEFGLYKQAFLLIGSSLTLLTFTFQLNVFYFLPRRPAEGTSIVRNVVVFHAAVGLAALSVLILYPQILDRLFGAGMARHATVIGVVILLTVVGYFLEVVATANQDVSYSTAFIINAQLTKSAATIFAALVSPTLTALLYAAMFQAAVQCAVLFWYLQKRFPGFAGWPDWKLMREQIGYQIPLGFGAVAVLAQTDLHLYMVANRFTAAEYAIYAIGCSQVPLIGILRESITAVVTPRVSYLQQLGDKRQIAALLAGATRKLTLVYVPAAVLLMVSAEAFITLLYSSTYSASASIFRLNMLSVPLAAILYFPVFRAYPENTGFLLRVRVAMIAVVAVAVWLGMTTFGMHGALAAVLFAMFTDYAILTSRAARVLELTRRDLGLLRDTGKGVLASIAAGAGTAAVQFTLAGAHPLVILVCNGAVFFLLYIPMLFLMSVPAPDEVALARSKLSLLRRLLKPSSAAR